MFRPLLLSLLILMALLGCKRNPLSGTGKTTVEGTVRDAITLNPIPNVPVSVIYKDKDIVGGWYSELKYVMADINGHYEVEFEAEKGYRYPVKAFHDYYSETNTQKNISGGKKNRDVDLELNPYGWVRMNYINEPLLDTASSIICNSFNLLALRGISTDTSQIAQLLAGLNQELVFFIRKGNYTSHTSIEVNVMSLDIFNVYVKY